MAFSFTVDAVIIYFFGMRTMSYLLMSVLFGLGFHPCAGNFIQVGDGCVRGGGGGGGCHCEVFARDFGGVPLASRSEVGLL